MLLNCLTLKHKDNESDISKDRSGHSSREIVPVGAGPTKGGGDDHN